MITASIVHYNSSSEELQRISECLLRSEVDTIWIIDHSLKGLPEFDALSDKRMVVIKEPNSGFGAGHNSALRLALNGNSTYHLVVNPDVFWENDVLAQLRAYMDTHPDTGMMLPKVLYPDGRLQYVCKRLPTPIDLVVNRFFNNKLTRKYISRFRLEGSGYDRVIDVPFLHGCFMMVRMEAFRKVGLFDERFFLYLEDTDMCRRIHRHYRTLFYPHATIYHAHTAASRSSLRMLIVHTRNALKYFNKWGWLFDRERRAANAKLNRKISEIQKS